MARCRGASSIIITDISASRLSVAKEMGADHVMLVGREGEGSEEVLASKVSSLIGGQQVTATIGSMTYTILLFKCDFILKFAFFNYALLKIPQYRMQWCSS